MTTRQMPPGRVVATEGEAGIQASPGTTTGGGAEGGGGIGAL